MNSAHLPASLTSTGRPLSNPSVATMPHASSQREGARSSQQRERMMSMSGTGSTTWRGMPGQGAGGVEGGRGEGGQASRGEEAGRGGELGVNHLISSIHSCVLNASNHRMNSFDDDENTHHTTTQQSPPAESHGQPQPLRNLALNP